MSNSVRQGEEWEKAKLAVREREGYCCQCCGKEGSQDELDDLQVHHIRAVKDGGGNDLGNLALVCNYCHWQIHRRGPRDGRYPASLASGDSGWESDFQNTTMEFNDGQKAVLGALVGRGEMKRKDILQQIPYTSATVSEALRVLRIAGRVTRVRRGVYKHRPVGDPREKE